MNNGEQSFKVGFHVSIAGGIDKAVDRALKIGCTTFQIFTHNPRSWTFKNLDTDASQAFIKKRQDAKIAPVFAHMSYLPNLSSPEEEIYQKSVHILIEELKRCNALSVPFLVTHCGSHRGKGFERGLKKICDALEEAYKQSQSKTRILLENTGGSKMSMGNSFEDLGRVIESLGNSTGKMIGICFDTCHAFVAGYDLRTSETVDKLMNKIEEIIGADRLKLVHANDAKYEKGSHRDRHEHIGQGHIGKGFRAILNNLVLRKLPFILETPRRSIKDDIKNLLTMKRLYQITAEKGKLT
ncbi:MAG: deoxyribonuclease IV [Promethearchaeota archaeon]